MLLLPNEFHFFSTDFSFISFPPLAMMMSNIKLENERRTERKRVHVGEGRNEEGTYIKGWGRGKMVREKMQ